MSCWYDIWWYGINYKTVTEEALQLLKYIFLDRSDGAQDLELGTFDVVCLLCTVQQIISQMHLKTHHTDNCNSSLRSSVAAFNQCLFSPDFKRLWHGFIWKAAVLLQTISLYEFGVWLWLFRCVEERRALINSNSWPILRVLNKSVKLSGSLLV